MDKNQETYTIIDPKGINFNYCKLDHIIFKYELISDYTIPLNFYFYSDFDLKYCRINEKDYNKSCKRDNFKRGFAAKSPLH